MSGLAGYLRDRPIWVKLGLIMMVPTIATVFVGFSALVGNISAASNADRARNLAVLTGDAGKLVNGLQNERAAATMLLSTTDPNVTKGALAQYRSLFGATNQASHTYTQHRNALSGLPTGVSGQLTSVDTGLESLDSLRQQVASPDAPVPLSVATQRYGVLISGLIDLRDAASQLAGDTGLSYDLRAGSALANMKEQLSQERVIVLQILNQGELTPNAQQQFLTALAGQALSLQTFNKVATPAQQSLLKRSISGPSLREAQLYEDTIHNLQPDKLPADIFGSGDWDSAMVGRAALMRQVEQSVDGQTLADATALHSKVQRQVLLEAILLVGLVLVAVLIAWLVARSMARALRELRQGALAVAQYGLPQAVARLRDPALSSQLSPQQMALQIAEPLPVRSKDEFGQVTEAFNAVHLEAVRTAAEQAALRSSVSTMFVNLARRSQILVDRLIGHLDRLERGEEDPDRLAELFQLDHLATRMRRNDENLLVLAGADSTRVQREPAALIDVLRAAQSEVEHYTRIEFGVIDRDIEVGAHAVNDLVHLVAELFDNATAFSPPDSTVIVEARRVSDRAVLFVEDHGIGISRDQLTELNDRLATPPMVDVAVSRMMGLVVVARLAARHGVKVELRPAAERGTIADVLLPTSVLVPRALTGRGPSAGGPLAREVPTTAPAANQPAPPRSPFATPLALETGPNGTGMGALTSPTTGGFGGGPGGYGNSTGYRPGAVNGTTSGAPVSGSPNGAGRHLPAWSDLTGAGSGPLNGINGINGTNGTNGADLLAPPPRPSDNRRGGPPPSGPGPQSPGFQSPGPQPPGPVPPGPGFMGTDPLPQRRATEPNTVDGEVTGDGNRRMIPRQVPSSPESWATGPVRPPDGVIDAVDADVVEERIAMNPAVPSRPAAPPPPAWPPVPEYPSHGPDGDEQNGAPPVPEQFAAALDITTEIPRVRPEDAGPMRPDWSLQSGTSRIVSSPTGSMPAVPQGYTPPPLSAPPQARPAEPARMTASHPDETMELPIFRELESAWFRGRDAEPAPMPAPTAAPAQSSGREFSRPQPAESIPFATSAPAASARNLTSDNGGMGSSPAAAGRPSGPEQSWRSAADDGWVAASAAAAPEVVAVTDAGLPKRVPMAQLVPGGVDKGPASANKRSPDQVRGLLSAYHRGVQRGRTRGDDKSPESSSTAGNSSQAGREQEA